MTTPPRFMSTVAVSVTLFVALPGSGHAASARSCSSIAAGTSSALVDISTRARSCRTVRRTLRSWRADGFEPAAGPSGWRCRVSVSSDRITLARYICRRQHARLRFVVSRKAVDG